MNSQWEAIGQIVERMFHYPEPKYRTLRLTVYPYARVYATFRMDADDSDEPRWCEGNGEDALINAVRAAEEEVKMLSEATATTPLLSRLRDVALIRVLSSADVRYEEEVPIVWGTARVTLPQEEDLLNVRLEADWDRKRWPRLTVELTAPGFTNTKAYLGDQKGPVTWIVLGNERSMVTDERRVDESGS